jgi:hypothetical protein
MFKLARGHNVADQERHSFPQNQVHYMIKRDESDDQTASWMVKFNGNFKLLISVRDHWGFRFRVQGTKLWLGLGGCGRG